VLAVGIDGETAVEGVYVSQLTGVGAVERNWALVDYSAGFDRSGWLCGWLGSGLCVGIGSLDGAVWLEATRALNKTSALLSSCRNLWPL
jgi:hypothetical protein